MADLRSHFVHLILIAVALFYLPGPSRDIFEDREGNMWFATDAGAVRYDSTQFRTFTQEDGLPSNRVRTVTQTPKGALWFGTLGGGTRG